MHTPDVAEFRRLLAGRTARQISPPETPKRAAVAVILAPDPDGLRVLFVRRAESASDPWSGHMAFPGGRFQPDDRDLRATAVRETREEIGVDLDRGGESLGRLDDIAARARTKIAPLVVSPFVYAVDRAPEMSPNAEIAEVLWAPLGPMFRGENATTIEYTRATGASVSLPGFDVGGRIVWGLTYEMLRTLFEIARGA